VGDNIRWNVRRGKWGGGGMDWIDVVSRAALPVAVTAYYC